MSINVVTLKWQFDDLTQSGLAATLVITPTEPLYDTTDHEIVAEFPRSLTFEGGSGQLAGIVANDDSQISPTGQGYTVVVTASNGQVIYDETVQILYSLGATQWLDSITPSTVEPSQVTYMLQPTGTPSAGQVPEATGVGQASAWTNPASGVASVFGRTGAVVAQSGDYTAAQVGADASGAAATAQSNAESFATSAVATETTRAEAAEALLAPLASPALTGNPTAPTQSTGNNSTRLATTAYVDGKIVSGQFLCAPNVWAPGSLTSPSTTSATYAAVSSGNACTNSFTAPPSGEVLVTATFVFHQATAAVLIGWALAATGTVSPLVADAWQVMAANTTLTDATTLPFVVTGLTPGSSYQFDLLFATSSASDTLSVAAQANTSTTLGTNKAGPVLMTVQAV